MLMPNKTTSLKKTLLFKSISLLTNGIEGNSLTELYKKNKRNFNDAGEFILAVDLLYILEKIKVDFETGIISYVK